MTVDIPTLRLETGAMAPLPHGVTTVGRSPAMDVRLTDPTVSPLHAELIRHGPYVYIEDLGLSRNGTRVNGRPVERRILRDGDTVQFGDAHCEYHGEYQRADLKTPLPSIAGRELEVLTQLCATTTRGVFHTLPTVREIARTLDVTEPTVRKYLRRIVRRLHIFQWHDDLNLLAVANEAVRIGLIPDARHSSPNRR